MASYRIEQLDNTGTHSKLHIDITADEQTELAEQCKTRAPREVEQEFYSDLFCGGDITAEMYDCQWVGLWGGPVIAQGLELDDNGEFVTVGIVWTEPDYALYGSLGGFDTLIATGAAVFTWVMID